MKDLSAEMEAARRIMRKKLLDLPDGDLSDAREKEAFKEAYYRAITLSEHEAARRATINLRVEVLEEAAVMFDDVEWPNAARRCRELKDKA